MSTVTLKGTPYSIKDDIPQSGIEGNDITFVRADLSELSLYDVEAKAKILIGVPSLDTGVCQTETRKFNEQVGGLEGVRAFVISKDLPFAMNRFCEAEGIKNVEVGSDYRYNDFINEYNTEILAGPFKGLSARAVFVLDSKNKVVYSELVKEIADEPNYDKAMAAVKSLL